jgi:hypothetical protein
VSSSNDDQQVKPANAGDWEKLKAKSRWLKGQAADAVEATLGPIGCKGECSGVGVSVKIYDEECSETFDTSKITPEMRKEAKDRALANANEQCRRRGRDCECGGGSFQVLSQCQEVVYVNGRYQCEYTIGYAYRNGRCALTT